MHIKYYTICKHGTQFDEKTNSVVYTDFISQQYTILLYILYCNKLHIVRRIKRKIRENMFRLRVE